MAGEMVTSEAREQSMSIQEYAHEHQMQSGNWPNMSQEHQHWERGSVDDGRSHDSVIPRVASGLGWFSIGLGIAQVASPSMINRMIGVKDDDRNRTLMQVVGLREIIAGMGILSSERPVRWLWGRVGGDVMDLALLTAALRSDDNEKDKVVRATLAVGGIAAFDAVTSEQFSSHHEMTM